MSGVCAEPQPVDGGALVESATGGSSLTLSPRQVALARKKEMSLEGFRREGSNRAAGRAGEVCEASVRYWLKHDEDYREAVAGALEEFAANVGQGYHSALAEHLAEVQAGQLVEVECEDEVETTPDGKTVHRQRIRRERPRLHPALAKLALTRYDPRFTHPKQQTQVDVRVSLAEQLWHAPDPPIDVTPDTDDGTGGVAP